MQSDSSAVVEAPAAAPAAPAAPPAAPARAAPAGRSPNPSASPFDAFTAEDGADIVPRSPTDAEAEAALLARLPPPIVRRADGRAAKRDRRAGCHSWATNGSCRFGTRCRFSHDGGAAGTTVADARSALRKMADARPVAGGGTGEGSGRGEGVAAAAAAAATAAAPAADEDDDAEAVVGAEADAPAAADPPAAGAAAGAAGGGEDEGEGGEASTVAALARLGAPSPLSALARYYTLLFVPDAAGSARGHDVFVALQSNRCAVLGIGPAHPIFRRGLRIVAVR
jgi:hypothetical protein